MNVSFVVRLVPGLPVGQFVGEAIEVASGEQSPIHDAEALIAFIARFLDEPPGGTPLVERDVSSPSEDLL